MGRRVHRVNERKTSTLAEGSGDRKGGKRQDENDQPRRPKQCPRQPSSTVSLHRPAQPGCYKVGQGIDGKFQTEKAATVEYNIRRL